MHPEKGWVACVLWHFDARGCDTQGKTFMMGTETLKNFFKALCNVQAQLTWEIQLGLWRAAFLPLWPGPCLNLEHLLGNSEHMLYYDQ